MHRHASQSYNMPRTMRHRRVDCFSVSAMRSSTIYRQRYLGERRTSWEKIVAGTDASTTSTTLALISLSEDNRIQEDDTQGATFRERASMLAGMLASELCKREPSLILIFDPRSWHWIFKYRLRNYLIMLFRARCSNGDTLLNSWRHIVDLEISIGLWNNV
jgi:hypothetical protein